LKSQKKLTFVNFMKKKKIILKKKGEE